MEKVVIRSLYEVLSQETTASRNNMQKEWERKIGISDVVGHKLWLVGKNTVFRMPHYNIIM